MTDAQMFPGPRQQACELADQIWVPNGAKSPDALKRASDQMPLGVTVRDRHDAPWALSDFDSRFDLHLVRSNHGHIIRRTVC
jgi:hypothetical protein